MRKYILSPAFAPVITILFYLLFVNCIYIFAPDSIPQVAEEKGLIEILTYANYALMFIAFAIFYKDFKTNLTDYFIFIFLAAAALLREMGIQHWLTSHDSTAFKIRFYTNPSNPISEKIISVSILIILLVVLLYVAKKYAVYLIKAFLRFDAISWTIATLMGFLLGGKIIDRLPGNYRHYHGEAMVENIRNILLVLEEASEMMLPVIVIIGLVQYHYINKSQKRNIFKWF